MTTPYQYGNWRSANGANAGMCWATIQPTKGTYNGTGSDQANMVLNWTTFDSSLDAAVTQGTAQGKECSVTYLLWRQPTWAVSAGDQAFTDPYGGSGAAGVPLNLQYVRDIVTAILQRAISRNRRIKFLELWNEPEFLGGANGRFFSGTAAQMVAMCNAAYTTAKAIDPGIVCLAPPQYMDSRLTAFLSATDGSKFGYQVCDGITIHPYRAGPNKAVQTGSDSLYWTAGGSIGIKKANDLLAALGQPAKPVYITEWGIAPGVSDPEVTAFNALSSAAKKTYVARQIAMAALGGVQMFTIFSNGNLAGDYTNDTTGVIAAVTEVHNALAGQTIIDGGYYADGRVTVVLANGTRYTW